MKLLSCFRNAFLIPVMALTIVMTSSAFAELPEGAQAPDFTLQGALGGEPLEFSLKRALRDGPVVLYFFPAAFTPGCTLEAHAFAEATEKFTAMHATVIGVTAGNIERVADFSKAECRSKFAVAADPGAQVAKLYDTQIKHDDGALSDRTSYVIAPDGKILLSFTSINPWAHVEKTMKAVSLFHDQK